LQLRIKWLSFYAFDQLILTPGSAVSNSTVPQTQYSLIASATRQYARAGASKQINASKREHAISTSRRLVSVISRRFLRSWGTCRFTIGCWARASIALTMPAFQLRLIALCGNFIFLAQLPVNVLLSVPATANFTTFDDELKIPAADCI
jgi:hypothetical protein